VGLVIFVSAAAADKFWCSVAASPWLWRHSWRWHWGPLSEAPRAWARPRPLSHQLQPPNALQFSQGAPVIPLRLTHGEARGITPRRSSRIPHRQLSRSRERFRISCSGASTETSPLDGTSPCPCFSEFSHFSRSVRFQLTAAKTH
jgi:hypothetical protein